MLLLCVSGVEKYCAEKEFCCHVSLKCFQLKVNTVLT
jgi:hypothetical protein